jgi:hypothetical protein
MPLLEVESSPAGSACCITCSRDTVAHGKGGVFLFLIDDLRFLKISHTPWRRLGRAPQTFGN